MKRTTIWTICLALLFGATITQVDAAGSTSWHLALATVGQVGNVPGSTETTAAHNALTQSDVEQLLSNARAAITARRFDQAEALIVQAERSGVSFGFFHTGDTPKKAREALNQTRLAIARSAGSQNQNPFAGQANAAPAIATGGQPLVNTTAGAGTMPAIGARGAAPAVATASDPNRSLSNAKLKTARLALAVGDTRRAKRYVDSAKQLNVAYGLADDSPAKVEAAVVKYEQVQANRAALNADPAWQKHYAQIMMEQAEGLLRYREFEVAERLATDAQRLAGRPEPYELNPADLLARIAKARTASSSNLVATPAPTGNAKLQTLQLLGLARQALNQGNLQAAEKFAMQASALNVPITSFLAGEDTPSAVALAIQAARVNQALPANAPKFDDHGMVTTSHYQQPENGSALREPSALPTEQPDNQPYNSTLPVPAPLPNTGAATLAAPVGQAPADAYGLLKQGEDALRAQKVGLALKLFRQAYTQKDQLDVTAAQRLQGHLQMLSANQGESLPTPSGSLLNKASDSEKVLLRKLSADISKTQLEAKKSRGQKPREAIRMLQATRASVQNATIGASAKSQLLRRVDLSITQTEDFIEKNRAQLELDAENKEILDEIARGRRMKLQIQQKIAELVEQFNQLRDEQRYAEMEVIARRLYELAPNEPVAQQVWLNAKSIAREARNRDLMDRSEVANFDVFEDIRESAVHMNPNSPIDYGGAHRWDELTKRRNKKKETRLNQQELEIKRRLKTPVELRYSDAPLTEVINSLSELAGINIHLDPLGMSQEGVQSTDTVTINLRNEISLESALRLILGKFHLDYVIKDEVLLITSEQLLDVDVYPEVYNVADLVIPIPNFSPSSNFGMQGLINDAQAAAAFTRNAYTPGLAPGPTAVASFDPSHPSNLDGKNSYLAQQMSGPLGAPSNIPRGNGPGGAGGAAAADFDALIELITTTVSTESWDEVGGPGSIKEFATNLSLVVSQTQEVHEQIADLLKQLRKLQDLQVTIEVRFITLSDRFFERIGVDFDFNIEDGPSELNPRPAAGGATEGRHRGSTVGLSIPVDPTNPFPNFTADLDIPFRNDSFSLAVSPAFSSPVDVASFGFAILSDIEAYFIIQAAQGDARSNILQAPKVTLFNGQLATVTDTTQRPFVVSVVPVVGDFAAAQQPVIIVLSEGTQMTIQAVVSDDRKYVRLTVSPFFSQIGEVQEFTFEGSTTSSSASSAQDDNDDGTPNDSSRDDRIVRSGTTVQQPTFSVIQVNTTVSVPDGGTVLLGGIKRLSEGRNEFGVPLLSKVPYINRLFRNVGIGRSTSSLMMMVTPRIIIQEEEEERLGILAE